MTPPQAGKVTLRSEPKEKAIPSNEERVEWPVLVHVVAPAKTERFPIDLVAVLDVSGSMTKATSMHGWTRLDLVKGAMKMVTNKLGAGDRLAIVPFNGKVATGATRLMEMTTKGRADANAKVNQLKAGGDTKFLPALTHASELLDNRPPGDAKYRPGFIFLLSDGQDNGVLDKLGGVRYPTHTFGMCQSGCNPKSMVHIASATKGSYHPINDELSNVAQALAVFLSGITSAVAVNARVELHVPDNSGVLIKKIDSGAYDKTIENGNGKSKGTINVGVMSAEEDKKFIVYLDVPKLENAQAKTPQLLLTVAGEYSTPAGGRKVENMDKSSIQVDRPAPAPAGATKTGDHHVTWSEAVMVEMVRIKVVSIVKEVLKKHEHDEEPDQKQMAKDLMAEWDKFIKETPAGKEAEERLKEKLPKHHVTDMHASLTKEEYDGVLYLYSWLASHQTQQATTMASSTAGVTGWFHQQYMQQAVADAKFDACGIQPGLEIQIDTTTGCDCDCVRIDRRLELWSNLKREVPLMFQPSEDAESHHLTAVFREASLDAINRAMHHDMYLAVVHASNLRRCYSGAGKQQLHGYGSSELPAHDEALPAPRAVEKHSE